MSAQLLIPSPTASTRSAATVAGSSGGRRVLQVAPAAGDLGVAQVHDHLEERLDHVDVLLGTPRVRSGAEQQQVWVLEEVAGVAVV